MFCDYKYEMTMIAMELAEEKFGKDFYELTQEQQFQTFTEAAEEWTNRAISAAESRGDL